MTSLFGGNAREYGNMMDDFDKKMKKKVSGKEKEPRAKLSEKMDENYYKMLKSKKMTGDLEKVKIAKQIRESGDTRISDADKNGYKAPKVGLKDKKAPKFEQPKKSSSDKVDFKFYTPKEEKAPDRPKKQKYTREQIEELNNLRLVDKSKEWSEKQRIMRELKLKKKIEDTLGD